MNRKILKYLYFACFYLILVSINGTNAKIDSLKNNLLTAKNVTKKIELNISLAYEYLDTDSDASFKYCNNALTLAKKNNLLLVETITDCGYIYYILNLYDEDILLLSEALKELEFTGKLEYKADLNKYLGYIYTELSDYDLANEYQFNALKIYKKLNLQDKIAFSYFSIANIYTYDGEYQKSLEYFLKAIEIHKVSDNKLEQADIYYAIGNSYQLLSEYEKALESFFLSLDIYKVIQNSSGEANAYNVIGNIFQSIESFDKALEYYKKSLVIQQKLNDQEGIAVANNNIGIIHDDMGDYETALKCYNKALQINIEGDDIFGICTSHNNIGLIHFKRKEYDLALKYLNKSKTMSEELNDRWAEANTSNNIAELYMELGDINTAFPYAKQGYIIAKDLNAKDILLESYNLYYKLYEYKKNYKLALEFYTKFSELKDKVFNTSIRKIASYQSLRETEKNEKEKEILVKNNQIKDLLIQEQKNLRIILFITIASVLASVLFLFKLYYNKRKENILITIKNNQILEQKSQLDNTIVEIKKLNSELSRNVSEINKQRNRLQIINKILRHDFANDFAVIKSALRLYRVTSKPNMLEEMDHRINKSLKSLSRLREQENFLTTYENLVEIELSEVLNSTINDRPEMNISFNGDSAVYADEGIYSIFDNLISNSVKHGVASKIDISITNEGNFSILKYSDNGIGIPDKIKEKVFEEGYVYGPNGHTGIGMFIVKRTIEEYGASIKIEDNLPSGVTFIIRFRKVV